MVIIRHCDEFQSFYLGSFRVTSGRKTRVLDIVIWLLHVDFSNKCIFCFLYIRVFSSAGRKGARGGIPKKICTGKPHADGHARAGDDRVIHPGYASACHPVFPFQPAAHVRASRALMRRQAHRV